jgi:large subunit ribosomal protein L6
MNLNKSISDKNLVLTYSVKKVQLLGILLYKYKNQYFLVDSKNRINFFIIPNMVNIKSDKLNINFTIESEKYKSIFDTIISGLKNFLFNNKLVYTKRVKIFGLGYKVLKEDKYLVFNLGYSQPLKIEIPYYLEDIIIKKNILIIKSSDKIALGNFIHFITHLKKRDIYKGKGLSLEYQTKKLKTVKKK